MDIEAYLELIESVNDFFECMGFEDEEEKVQFARTKLRKGARAFWENPKRERGTT